MDWLTSKDYDDWKTSPPEPIESRFKCTCCGEDLYLGDPYWDIEGEHYCADCAEEWFNDQKSKVTEEQCYGEE